MTRSRREGLCMEPGNFGALTFLKTGSAYPGLHIT